MIGMSQCILTKGLLIVKAINAIIALKDQNRPLKGTGAIRDVCPGSSASRVPAHSCRLPQRSRRLWRVVLRSGVDLS